MADGGSVLASYKLEKRESASKDSLGVKGCGVPKFSVIIPIHYGSKMPRDTTQCEASALNYGLSQAKGAYIAFLDHGDI